MKKPTPTRRPAGAAAIKAIVVGAGLSGLTAAALLAERGLEVTVVEQCDRPGGAASAFRRGEITFDIGAAMMFGFGEKGFNPHNWLMTELGEPIEMYRHEAMYRLFYGDSPITFHADRERFIRELERLFPRAGGEIKAFYDYIGGLYDKAIAPVSLFEAPNDMPLSEMRRNAKNGLKAQLTMVGLLFRNAESMMRPFIHDPQARAFFDKLTSTYCYTTIRETPAILAATMFIDNHVGGAYYPAGSAMALSSRLEKAIEARGGRFLYRTKAKKVLGEAGRITGIATESGEELKADLVLFAGSLRAFARSMDPDSLLPRRWKEKILGLEMTMPSFVVYGSVKKAALPADAMPVQMFVDNREALDEGDVTLYLPSLEDPSLAPPGLSTFLIIGPSMRTWPEPWSPDCGGEAYSLAKKAEADRMLALVERRMPGFMAGVEERIEASPTTIWRYLGKTGGSVAGPKQKMGQHLLLRQGSRGPVPGLYFAGESTVMGTGTPAVTVSGISAANRILRTLGLQAFSSGKKAPSSVRIIPKGCRGNLPVGEAAALSSRCRWCEKAPCAAACPARFDIPGIMRRMEANNIVGAGRQLVGPAGTRISGTSCAGCAADIKNRPPCEAACIRRDSAEGPVSISRVIASLS